jgi:DNA (cytosine-5)-methyltransferase 1
LKFGSVCSGIEAASVAWRPLGWEASFVSEIEPFPCAVLNHHYGSGRPRFMPDPDAAALSSEDRLARLAAIKAIRAIPEAINPTTPNLGDMTRFQEWPDYAIDLLVGGTPCQGFSVAGFREGLADPRSNLMLTYLAIAAKYRTKWLVWENVPGALSTNEGRDFGALLWGLGQLGYGVAYRIFDAQYGRSSNLPFAVPQRRRRVFVVGYLGDWRRAAAVLFDAQSLRGDSPPGRRSGQRIATALTASAARRGGVDDRGDGGGNLIPEVASTLPAGANSTGGDRQPGTSAETAATMLIPEVANPLTARMVKGVNTTMDEGQTMIGEAAFPDWRVRRLTPRECCRLQGFPDDYLSQVTYRGKAPADGPMYKALGNSMPVNIMEIIGERIALVDAIE